MVSDWPTVPHCWGHQLPNLHQRLRADAHGWAKTLVLSLKQCYAHYYHFYKKEMTRTMVGLQGLHYSNSFRCFNMYSSVGRQHWDNSHTPQVSALLGWSSLWHHSVSHLPACLHQASWSIAQDVRPSMWKNIQDKKDMRWKNHIKWSPNCRNRRKHPNC